MQTEKLTPGQSIALNTFLCEYESRSFENIINVILAQEASRFLVWRPVEDLDPESLVEAITNLSIEIDNVIQNHKK